MLLQELCNHSTTADTEYVQTNRQKFVLNWGCFACVRTHTKFASDDQHNRFSKSFESAAHSPFNMITIFNCRSNDFNKFGQVNLVSTIFIFVLVLPFDYRTTTQTSSIIIFVRCEILLSQFCWSL